MPVDSRGAAPSAGVATRLDALIEPLRVHGSLYTDEALFREELERIWYRHWVFVGHASEVPDPGSHVRKAIGPRPVTLLRTKDGAIDVPEAARVDAYRGFVFASFAPSGVHLLEHLGDAALAIDRLVRLSPAGEVRLDCGWLAHTVDANWKIVVENETDGYHPNFVHASIFSAAPGPLSGLFDKSSPAVARELGLGHTELDLTAQFRVAGPLSWVGSSPDRLPEYVTAMRAAHGDAADQIMLDGPPHVMIFPNLFIAEIQVFAIQPVSVGRTVQSVTAVQLERGADINRKLLRQTIGSVGPAGLLLADDAEMYERNQRGVAARRPEWLDLSRGSHREYRDDRGHLTSHVTDEVTQRAFWRHYRAVIEGQ